MTTRLEPTPEDLAIFQRSVRRLLRWDAAKKRLDHSAGDVLQDGRRFVAALRNMTNDYVEFGPLLPRNGAVGLGVESETKGLHNE